jgi:hypothetical protein
MLDWVHSEILQRKIRFLLLIGHSMVGTLRWRTRKHGDFIAGLAISLIPRLLPIRRKEK